LYAAAVAFLEPAVCDTKLSGFIVIGSGECSQIIPVNQQRAELDAPVEFGRTKFAFQCAIETERATQAHAGTADLFTKIAQDPRVN